MAGMEAAGEGMECVPDQRAEGFGRMPHKGRFCGNCANYGNQGYGEGECGYRRGTVIRGEPGGQMFKEREPAPNFDPEDYYLLEGL